MSDLNYSPKETRSNPLNRLKRKGAYGKCRHHISNVISYDPRFNHALRHQLAAEERANEKANQEAYNG